MRLNCVKSIGHHIPPTRLGVCALTSSANTLRDNCEDISKWDLYKLFLIQYVYK